jgi:hypothetical protein
LGAALKRNQAVFEKEGLVRRGWTVPMPGTGLTHVFRDDSIAGTAFHSSDSLETA